MEKLNKPYRQEYENLLNKQTEERKVFVDSAHKEALEDSRKIAALESEASEIKRGKVGGMEFIEGIEDVVEQYEKQKEILQKVGVLETLSDGVLGVKGIDGKEYAYPTQTELAERMEAKQEILETKKNKASKNSLSRLSESHWTNWLKSTASLSLSILKPSNFLIPKAIK